MITKKMKLLALATASTLFLAGCGGESAEDTTPKDYPTPHHYKNAIQAGKRTTTEKAKTAKEKAEKLTAKGLDKASDKLGDAAGYMDPDSSDED